MHSAATTELDRILLDLEQGTTMAVKYPHKSFYGRCEPMVLTTILAVVAILASMLTCETTTR
jgi:hypothetical protein